MHPLNWHDSSSGFGSNVCRLCALVKDVLLPIYQECSELNKIEQKIRKCLPIVVSKDDDKPQQVCLECLSKLNVSFELLEQSLAAEFKFESFLDPRLTSERETNESVSVQCASPRLVRDSTAEPGSREGSIRQPDDDPLPQEALPLWEVDSLGPTQQPHHAYDEETDPISSSSPGLTASVDPESGSSAGGEVEATPAASLTVHAARLSSDGVIVLSKAEGIQGSSASHKSTRRAHSTQEQSSPQPGTDGGCQDILVMVELKYKDVLVSDPRVEATTSNTHTMPAFISAEPGDRQNLATVSIEANASTIPSVPSGNNTLVPQATVVLDASALRASVAAENLPHDGNGAESQADNPVGSTATGSIVALADLQGGRRKPFSCDVCGKTFMRKSNLNAHMGNHTQVKPHSCDICGKSFVVRWDLTLHQRIHAGLFACEFCGKAFSVKGKLERHRRVHTGERPFSCDVCTKAFGDKRNLEAHRRCHTGERPFVCLVCGRSFRVNSHLSDHRRVHSQEKPFTCHICGKSFKWKANLTIHLRSHAGQHFSCEVCAREFSRRADLQKHLRSHCGHSGERPFHCDICSKRSKLQRKKEEVSVVEIDEKAGDE